MPPHDRPHREPPRLGDVRPDRASYRPPYSDARRQPDGHLPAYDTRHRPASAPRPPAARRSRGRLALVVLASIVALVLAAGAILAIAPPVDLVRARVAAEVERQTGRKLVVRSAGISFSGGFGVTLSDLSLSAPAAMGGRPLLVADRVEVSLALLPLVLREVKVERLTLVKPELSLRVDREGRRSWEFTDAMRRPLRYAQAGGRTSDAERLPAELQEFVRNASSPGAGGGRASAVEAVTLADVRILDGRLRYEDDATGSLQQVTGIDASLAMPAVGGPLSVKGHAVLAGERIAIDARVDQLRELVADRPTVARVKLDSNLLAGTYEGRLALGAQSSGDGRFSLSAPSAARLARQLQIPVVGLEQIGAVSLAGQIRASSGGAALTAATIRIGATQGTGTLSLEMAGDRPRIAANLRLAALDMDQLTGVAIGLPEPSLEAGSAGRFAAPPNSIDELLAREAGGTTAPPPAPGPRVHGFRQRAGNQWETDALEATFLRAVDADVRLQVAKVTWSRLPLAGVGAAELDLKAGVLRANLTDVQLAGGGLRGLVSVDARQPALVVGVNVSGDGVALKPLLEPNRAELIDGRAKAVVALSAQGSSERELVSSLSGKIDVKVSDGHLYGWDADAIVADLARARMPPAHRQPGARTPFRELSAAFQIAHGVARTSSIKLDSPTVAASGTGTVNIVDRNVDFHVKPRLGTGGLEVPVRIAGPWDDPSAVADVDGALKSPQAQQAVRHLRDGDVDGALRSVLGNGPKAEEKIGKAKDIIRGILGRGQ